MKTGTETGVPTGDVVAPDDRARVRAVVAMLAVVAIVAAAVVATWGPDGDEAPHREAAALGDGDHVGYLRINGDGTVDFDVVELLSGQEAVDAAHEDGALPLTEDSMPNDVYLRNPETSWVDLRVDPEASLVIHDCSTGCEQIEADLEGLLDGTVVGYGGVHALFEITVSDGEVIAFAEQYLP